MSILVKTFIKEPKAILKLQKFEMSEVEKNKIAEIITLIYHQQLLNHLLARLDFEGKQLFLEKHLTGNQEEAISFLQERVVDIEKIVEIAVAEIEEKLDCDFAEILGE